MELTDREKSVVEESERFAKEWSQDLTDRARLAGQRDGMQGVFDPNSGYSQGEDLAYQEGYNLGMTLGGHAVRSRENIYSSETYARTFTPEDAFEGSNNGEPILLSHLRVSEICRAHGQNAVEYFEAIQEQGGDPYDAASLLGWLGY